LDFFYELYYDARIHENQVTVPNTTIKGIISIYAPWFNILFHLQTNNHHTI